MQPPFPSAPNPEDDQERTHHSELDDLDDLAELAPASFDPPLESETTLPPEAQGQTNGGPLGCCLGVTVGLLFSLLISVIGFGHNLAFLLGFILPFSAITDIRIATGCLALVGTIIFGYFGWKIGKRLYREYESPVVKIRSRKRKTKPKAIRF